jgi:SAM-dependent MidA family methyltransferase
MTPDRTPPSGKLPPPTAGPATPDHSAAGAVLSSVASARSTELTAVIRAEIEAAPGRRITFEQYMDLALNEPRLGYYRQPADRPTDAGDFLTAPETHPIFGWTVARRLESMWEEMSQPRQFNLIEHGAGSGTLALSILEGFRRHGRTDLLEAVRYTPSESNEYRQADLLRRFEEAGLARVLLPAAPQGSAGVILANEFLDALPVHRVVVQGGELRELFVVWREEAGAGAVGGFAEMADSPSTPNLAAHLADDCVELAEGQVAEICLALEVWLQAVATNLARGFILAIDYGYEAAELYGPRHLAGTLLGYRGHRIAENPFEAPGETDLTAHVDFTAVAQVAAGLGFRTVSLTTQSEFLVAAGLEEELRALQFSPDLTPADYTRARSGIVRMLDPRHMGRFRVLVLER